MGLWQIRIIEPLASRCAKFRFQTIGEESHFARLKYICEKENFSGCDDAALREFVNISDGDLRRSISLLQSTHMLDPSGKTQVTRETVREIAGRVPPNFITESAMVFKSGNFNDVIKNVVDELMANGYPVTQFLIQLLDEFSSAKYLTDKQKAKSAKIIAEADQRLTDGSDERLQMTWVCTQMRQIVQGA